MAFSLYDDKILSRIRFFFVYKYLGFGFYLCPSFLCYQLQLTFFLFAIMIFVICYCKDKNFPSNRQGFEGENTRPNSVRGTQRFTKPSQTNGGMLLLGFVDNGLGNLDSIIYIVHVETCMHVVVEEVTGLIIVETADVIIEPFGEGFALNFFYLVFV